MNDFEKLGIFYLGKNSETKRSLLYESKNFTTHAVCLGMTGSGKTGLGITVIEEAALDKIPVLAIDPKGDLTNLLLTFPGLTAEEFKPWVDESEAEKRNLTLDEYAKEVAKTWKEGLAEWQEGPERIAKLRDAVEMEIYTPASRAGLELSVLNSLKAPSEELSRDQDAMRGRLLSTTSSLLGLVGIQADPIKSREYILVSTIIANQWKLGKDLDIASLIKQVQNPLFGKLGALDIDTFFPPKDRLSLSIALNNLLASPGFQAWREGAPLDIQSLLYTDAGKPKVSILYIAHLSDSERMFFVTLLLNEFLSWMRRQPGTSSLRALLYMDEVAGYFPPVSEPPSKAPMLTLLKQARAYGIGIMLCTQNPVDLDYKGLSNCGTWFIGKLQTENDRSRVLGGLEQASNGELNAKQLKDMVSSLSNRTFLLRSIYEKEPILFQTRWTLSYLRGPLTLSQIEKLTPKKEEKTAPPSEPVKTDQEKPQLTGVKEYFINEAGTHTYRPKIAGFAKLHFTDSKTKVDVWQNLCLIAPFEKDSRAILWLECKELKNPEKILEKNPLPESRFLPLPRGLNENYLLGSKKNLLDFLLENHTLNIFKLPEFKMVSEPFETEVDFRLRLQQKAREIRDEAIAKLKEKFDKKLSGLTEKLTRAGKKLAQKQQSMNLKKTDTWISVGTTLLGAFLGRGVTKGTISNAGTSIKNAGRINKESQELQTLEQDYANYQSQIDTLNSEFQNEMTNVAQVPNVNDFTLQTIPLKPKKSDTAIDDIALVWTSSE